MNELLQKHGCANVFTIPEGLKELMSDISREVLRAQPPKIFEFIASYLSALLITREHGILAVKILDDLCDCRPSVSEHLIMLGVHREEAESLAQIIKEEIEAFEPKEGKEKVKEADILKKVLKRSSALDEEMTQKICQVARNAYRDYWYRKKVLQKSLKVEPDEPWEIAAQHTLEIYKKTKPSFSELARATQRIQSAYRGYHVRRQMLAHLKPKKKKGRPKEILPGPPLDIAESREIELGPVLNLKVREENVAYMFTAQTGENLGLKYDPMKTLIHLESVDRFMTQEDAPVSTLGPLKFTDKTNKYGDIMEGNHPPGDSPSHDLSYEAAAKISFAKKAREIFIHDHDEKERKAHEVPEDISDYRSDLSSVAHSVASSRPGTANTSEEEEE